MTTLATKVCVAPIAQQVVGLGTVLSNSGKLLQDLALKTRSFFQTRSLNKQISLNEAYYSKLQKVDNYDLNELDKVGNTLDQLQEKKNKLAETNAREHVKYIGIGLLRAIPVIGSIYSLYVWSYEFDPKASKADKLSLYLITQQVVGLGTIVSNIGKIANDIRLGIVVRFKKSQLLRSRNQYENIVFDSASGVREPRLKPLLQSIKKLEKEIEDKSKAIDFYRHLNYVGVGVLRTIPVAGTYLSASRCSKVATPHAA